VVAINRNGWSQSIGIAGRDHPVCAVERCESRHTGASANLPTTPNVYYTRTYPCEVPSEDDASKCGLFRCSLRDQSGN
jgi:hypothetical protein